MHLEMTQYVQKHYYLTLFLFWVTFEQEEVTFCHSAEPPERKGYVQLHILKHYNTVTFIATNRHISLDIATHRDNMVK